MSNPFKILDEASLRWHHIKMMLVAAVGTFTDGYDLTMLGLVLTPLLASFGISNIKSSIGVFWATWLNALPIFGFLVGAPVFGYLVNKGRKRFYGVDVALMSIGAGLQFIAQSLVELAIFRFMMGI
ncbi:MAG: MFS transporter, partial [Caldivirga sp.]